MINRQGFFKKSQQKGLVNIMVYAWLIALIAFVVIELFTTQLVSIWFAGGALSAFIAACAGASLTLQWILFIAISALLLILTKPFVTKIINRNPEKTNVEAHIGRVTTVTEKIDNLSQSGQIKFSGISWAARSSDDDIIDVGEKVIVEKVEGVKLIVKRY